MRKYLVHLRLVETKSVKRAPMFLLELFSCCLPQFLVLLQSKKIVSYRYTFKKHENWKTRK